MRWWYLSHWALTKKKTDFVECEQHRGRATCTSTQTDQRLCNPLSGKKKSLTCYRKNFTILTRHCSWAEYFVHNLARNLEDSFLGLRPICCEAAQPVHFSSLISIIVIRFFECIIVLLIYQIFKTLASLCSC